MNAQGRKALQKVTESLETLKSILEDMQGDEESKLEDLSEAAQEGTKGDTYNTIIQELSDAVDDIDTAIEHIKEAMDA